MRCPIGKFTLARESSGSIPPKSAELEHEKLAKFFSINGDEEKKLSTLTPGLQMG